ncbi:MAG: diaminopimelate decarboxylase [Gammaproteobacteria bacterium]
MDYFTYRNGQLHAEAVPLAAIAAAHGTPCYVYSRAAIEHNWKAFAAAFAGHPHTICYGVKANGNLAVLNVLARLGAGFDIVSVGELERVLAAGGDPRKVVFSGVGKRPDEIDRALAVGIRCFNVESEAELASLNDIAGRHRQKAAVSLRVNPDVDAQTHPYISTGLKQNKFGIDIQKAPAVYAQAAALPNLRITGIDCHIGSQLTQIAPFTDALERVLLLADSLRRDGIGIEHLDLGGGLGIRYRDESPPQPADYAAAILATLGGRPYELFLEPGRAIIGNAGLLLTRVLLLKATESKRFAVVDAAMNDLIRPALYQAWHDIVPVAPRPGEKHRYDIVGPVCESADFLGKERELALAADDLLAIQTAGAYSFVMSSNYNSRPRAAEVIVDGEHCHLARRRETTAELFAGETTLPTRAPTRGNR